MTVYDNDEHPDLRDERSLAMYVGQSHLLHVVPVCGLVAAIVPVLAGAPGAALLVALPSFLLMRIFPWRFAVCDLGIGLWFGLGRYRFLAKEDVVVSFRHGAPFVGDPRHGRLGTMLIDEQQRGGAQPMRHALRILGFRLEDDPAS